MNREILLQSKHIIILKNHFTTVHMKCHSEIKICLMQPYQIKELSVIRLTLRSSFFGEIICLVYNLFDLHFSPYASTLGKL